MHLGTILNDQSILLVGLSQNTRTAVIATGRGTIYDRNLTPLVNAGVRYRGALVPEMSQLNRLRGAISEQEYKRLADQIKQQSLLIAELNSAPLSGQKLRTFELPQRYEEAVPCAHLIGYLDESGYTGQAGIEKAYNDLLTQYSGKITVTYQVDGAGHCQTNEPISATNTINQCSGGIQLTIDAKIQRLLDDLASQYLPKGAAVVMDVQTGEILACTSLPNFHPERLQSSIQQENGALINRILAGYDCGSIFKIITAAAALENNVSPEQTFVCPGELMVGNTLFHCHQRLGHQTLDMNSAFAQSCNLYFIQLAQQIGGAAILNTAKTLGLYNTIKLAEGLSAPAAVLPELSALFPAALANLSFGQGELLVSPLHVAQITVAIANGGILMSPSVVMSTVDKDGNLTQTEKGRGEPIFSATTSAQLRWMMEQVVNNGTGTRAQPNRTTAAGKTGTAQTGQINDGSPVIQSWFTGYFPAEDPQYAITILAEDAENNGGDAQGLFREMVNKLYHIK